MTQKIRLFLIISGLSVSAFSFLVIAGDPFGARPLGSEPSAVLPPAKSVAGGLPLLEADGPKTDLAITARIRRGITSGRNLSANARNVKVTTTGGRVVLQGVVITAEEKRLIGDIAIGILRRENVDNQLVVRSAPSAPTGLRVSQ